MRGSAATQNREPTTAHRVYWTLGGSSTGPQIQSAAVPLRKYSQAQTTFADPRNGLSTTSGIAIDRTGKRVWVLTFGKERYGPTVLAVFNLPLTASSAPAHRFVLGGSDFSEYLTFDAAGHLWVTSRHNDMVLEYTGPFDRNGTLVPQIKLHQGLKEPMDLAFDPHGNLYVSNFASTGERSIVVYKAPISKRKPYYLNGLVYPGALAFDKNGNLYSSTNGPSYSATVRYDANDLTSGSRPSIVDPLKLYHAYGASFAFSSTGDLYVANCGAGASVFVYPTGEKPFTSKLPPSLDYTDYEIEVTACVWGIAVR